MKVVLAEKPSVAREIANLLGASEKKDGYLAGNGYSVTWAFGHLIALGMPEDYGISGFDKKALPFLPNPFILTLRKVKKGKELVIDKRAGHQLRVIERLFKECESIIVATDAGREGELIFRYIYEYLNCKKTFQRLWISSLTEKAIQEGFKHLKPGNYYDGLYAAAQCRSRADWLLGINSTQALSIAVGDGIYSLGRVQTPTLAVICKRYQENQNFTSQKYLQIELLHNKDFVEFKSLSVTRFTEKKQAEDLVKLIERNGIQSTIAAIDTKTVTEQSPLLFDLTGLQKEANKRFNFTAEETLNIAQSLYEKKFITYPRTGSQYIPEDVWPEIPDLIRALHENEQYKPFTSILPWGNFNKKIVNNLKVTDHHGLLTTEKVPSALSGQEKAIYELIAFRLLESVSQPCIKEITTITLKILHYDFAAKGSKVLQKGWRSIYGSFSDDLEKVQEFPELKEGMEVKTKMINILDKKTQAPALYTEASLLSAMENAGKEIENEEQKKVLKNLGIGTPATRASIIEILLDRGYILRKQKSLIPTEKGLRVYELVKDRKIADVSLTAEWELDFQRIKNKELDATAFQKKIEVYTQSVTEELLQNHVERSDLPKLVCPKCKVQHLIIHHTIIKCPDENCNWLQFRNICEIQLSLPDIESLVKKGKTSLIRGMKSKSGNQFNAYIALNEDYTTSFTFEPKNK
ncbi:DNA topoisomerase [Chryseobacterium sp. C39-AII1]|uniref:type IA DNA topoisomerase n=1 Tax=Chryseobacterium sp. C39-AII1 TaxID=3080332 RepID=UPI0032090F4B